MLFFNDLPAAKPEYEQTLFGMARFILRSIEIAKREGVLSLEGYVSDKSSFNKFVGNDFTDKISEHGRKLVMNLIQFTFSGLEKSVIEKIVFYSVSSFKNFSGDEEKIALMMAAEGVLSIINDDNPHITGIKLSSMLGDAFYDRQIVDFGYRGINVFRPVYEEIIAEYEKAAAEKNLVKAMYVPDPNFSDLKVLCSLDEVTVQKIVEENLDSIAKAVAFDDEIQQKIFASVSPETVLKIKKEIEELKKPVLESQEKILNSLRAKVRNVSGNTVVFDA
ncbi:MAG: hypothetical protein IKR40_08335 [Treponema sp.]|nr:hypothetical protein [Treponema sp.]